jgi:hypothetical protein
MVGPRAFVFKSNAFKKIALDQRRGPLFSARIKPKNTL